MDVVKEATKILKKEIGWIQLNLDFDLLQWKHEADQIKKYLVNHREGDGHTGWKSCCIHGISTSKTGNWDSYENNFDDVSYTWTDISKLTPNIMNFWKKFPTQELARVRFMQLDPGGWVASHNDSPGGVKNTEFEMMDHMIPINIAITHPANCVMSLENYGEVPWQEGKSFIVNITDNHSVVNNSPYTRTHLIAHCIIGNQKKIFSKLLLDSYKNHDT